MSSFRFAHLSDLHFLTLSFGISQFFSKRWIGNANLILRRRKTFNHKRLDLLIAIFLQEKVDFVLISGDLTCSSLEKEFLQARLFIQKIKDAGIPVILLPGNHDHYTKKAFKEKVFYRFFPVQAQESEPFSLKEHRVEIKPLPNAWWLITLDTTLATPLLSSHGQFCKETEKNLSAALASLPSEAKVILANHFPIALENHRSLKGEEKLLALLAKHPQIKLYLHGHSHKRRICDKRKNQLPVISDAGSASHQHRGSWNLIECKEDSSFIQPFVLEKGHWVPEKKHYFTWSD